MTNDQFQTLINELRTIRKLIEERGMSNKPPLLRYCPHCNTPHYRRDPKAKFCCDEHRVAFNSLKRTPNNPRNP